MKKIKKVAVTPIEQIDGSIVDGTNIDDKTTNTYSANIIDGLVNAIGLGGAILPNLGSIDLDNLELNGFIYFDAGSYDSGNGNFSYSYLLQLTIGNNYKFQLVITSSHNGVLRYRKKSGGTWGSWYTITATT